MKRLLILGVGYGFLVLGVLGLFLPFLQGFLFLAIGLMILSSEALWARRVHVTLKRRYPAFGRFSRQAEAKTKAWMAKLRREPAADP